MGKVLSAAALEQYRRDGYHFPIRALSTGAARDCRAKLEAFEAAQGGPLRSVYRHKTHLLFTWLDELIRTPTILDAVEDVLGPDMLCWTTNFFTKEARTTDYVSWHQDATYWGLGESDIVTAWVAFTESAPPERQHARGAGHPQGADASHRHLRDGEYAQPWTGGGRRGG